MVTAVISAAQFRFSRPCYGGQKFLAVIVCQFKKKNCNPYFIVIMITILIMNVIFWVVNFKTQNYFVISTTQNVYLRLSMYDCSNFVHSCRIFGNLSFKQFKLIVKMTRIGSGVTIPKGLFTLDLYVKKVTAKIFWPP
jgi:hypothetical protein